MTIEEMRKRREELGLTYEQLAMKSGVPLGTVQKVLGGITKSPRYDTIQALERVLNAEMVRQGTSVLQEEAASYAVKKQSEYTLEDYYKIPDDRRVELIDGVFYDIASPDMVHHL